MEPTGPECRYALSVLLSSYLKIPSARGTHDPNLALFMFSYFYLSKGTDASVGQRRLFLGVVEDPTAPDPFLLFPSSRTSLNLVHVPYPQTIPTT